MSSTLNSIKAKFGWKSLKLNKGSAKFCGFCSCSVTLLAACKKSDYPFTEEDKKRPGHCWFNPNSAVCKADKS